MEFFYLKKLISDDKNTNTVVIQTVFIHCKKKKKNGKIIANEKPYYRENVWV